MNHRTLLVLATTLAIAAPRAGRAQDSSDPSWSLTLGVWDGVSRYDVLGLEHGVSSVGSQERNDLLHGNFNAAGAQAVLRLGWLDLGLLYEGTLLDSHATSDVVTPLVGFKWDMSPTFRLDVLGELGGHRIEHIGSGNALVTDTRTVWLPSIGIRPSVSYRMPAGPVRLVLSLTPFARWDLVQKSVDVPSGPGSVTTYRAGGSTFGLVGGVGVKI